MKSEVMRILKMVEEGKIDSEAAAKLIDALNNGEEVVIENDKPKKSEKAFSKEEISDAAQKFLEETPKNGEMMLYVFVMSGDGDKVKVKIPISFIKTILDATNKMPSMKELDDKVDMEVIKQAIENGVCGRIVEVESADGDFVIVEIK